MQVLLVYLLSQFSVLNNFHSHVHWSGTITKDAEDANIYFCYDPAENEMVFGLPDLGYTDLPVSNLKVDSAKRKITAVLSYFGNDKLGEIHANFNRDGILNGELIWHGSSLPLELKLSDSPIETFTTEEIEFFNEETKLAGSLILPKNSEIKPAIIFIPGSGPFTRYWANYYAREFASIGYASLIFDKRGSGQSEGSWVTSSLEDLAGDVASAFDFLSTRSDINKNKIGLWGISQGGWIATKAATSINISFMIINSGGGISPYEEEMFSYEVQLSRIGATPDEIKEAKDLLKIYFDYLGTGIGREKLLNKIEDSKQKSWYDALNIHQVLPSEKNRSNWEWVATYISTNDIQLLNLPVLLLFGSNDIVQPTAKSIEEWKKGFVLAGNKNYSIKIFEAGHGIRIGGHGHHTGWPQFAPGYLEAQMQWLKNL